MALALALLLSYLLGAVPFGFVMARLRGVDLRTIGSGNIGATNAMRALGKPLGLTAFALDLVKGWVPVAWIAPALVGADGGFDPGWARVLCGAAAVSGHVWPVYLGFRGGKGVATGCGGIVAIDPWIFVWGGVVWLVTLLTTRFVGLSSMLMGVAFALTAFLRREAGGYGLEVVFGTGALALLILARHRSNLGRMLAGTEPRAGRRRAGGG